MYIKYVNSGFCFREANNESYMLIEDLGQIIFTVILEDLNNVYHTFLWQHVK